MQNRTNRPQNGYRPPSGSAPRRPSSAASNRSSHPTARGAPRQSSNYGSARRPSAAPRTPYGTGDSRRAYAYASTRRPPSGTARRSSPPPGGNRAQRPPNRPTPRRPRRRRISLSGLICIALVVAVAVYVVQLFSVVGVGIPTFISNVYVNGVSYAGLTKEEGFAKAAELEQEWLNTAYTFSYGDNSWNFTRASVNAEINLTTALEQAWNLGHVGSIFERKHVIETIADSPIHLSVSPTYDQSLVDAFIDEICAAIDVDAVDAVVIPDVNQPVVLTESRTGLKVNREQLLDQVTALLIGDDVDTALPVETVFPSVNSDDVSFQVIAQYSTDVSFRSRNSRTNVRIALNAFNGITVQPGETVSFNEVVGERSKANGFQEATEFAGDMTTLGVGGGVCQASTTLYNALVTAGMTITDRSQHTMTVSYVDPSLDAAVTWTSKDLKFKNETDYPIYIYTSVTDDDATVTIYGHRPDYYYRLESVVTEENIASTRINYIEDTEGKYVTYTDETYRESQGKSGCKSEGWIVAYDWDTKQEVFRTQISNDNYLPGASVYYVGVTERAAETTLPDGFLFE